MCRFAGGTRAHTQCDPMANAKRNKNSQNQNNPMRKKKQQNKTHTPAKEKMENRKIALRKFSQNINRHKVEIKS